MLNPSRFEFLSNFFPLSTFNLTVCLTVSLPLSACLPVSLLAYPPVCLPACLSTCLPVCCSSLDKPPACCCLMKPTTREMRSRGGKKRERGRYKVRGFRTRRAKAKCLSETPALLLHRSSRPPACQPIDGVLKGGVALIAE